MTRPPPTAEAAAEREVRIADYARRVAAGQRLFEPTPAELPECDRPGRRACLGCGRSQTAGWGKGTAPPGWVVRRIVGAERYGQELHCPGCLRRWGLGVGLEGEEDGLPGEQVRETNGGRACPEK